MAGKNKGRVHPGLLAGAAMIVVAGLILLEHYDPLQLGSMLRFWLLLPLTAI